jgi:hypothetical protein
MFDPMLHVTSGDIIANALEQAYRDDAVIAWRDVLEEGPIPAGLTDDQLASLRATFLASLGWGTADELRQEFATRNQQLREANEVTLWFEYDLHDQLHLLQILSMLGDSQVARLIEFPPGAIKTASQARALESQAKLIDAAQLESARQAWEALRSPQPSAYWTFVEGQPTLAAALRRLFEQIPGSDGLSRTERQILKSVHDGVRHFEDLFKAVAASEEHAFLGDTSLRVHLKRLTSGFHPPLTPEPFALTEVGRRVLRGEASLIEENGIDRWVGGARFTTY